MSKIDIPKEIVNTHSDEEILLYMYQLALKVRSAYNTTADCLLVSLASEKGDVDLLLDIIREYKNRISPKEVTNV